MSNLDWSTPDWRNEEYWKDLYNDYLKRYKIFKKYHNDWVPHLDPTILWYCPNKDNFKVWYKKFFNNLRIILSSPIWIDPTLQYTTPKYNSTSVYPHSSDPRWKYRNVLNTSSGEIISGPNIVLLPGSLTKHTGQNSSQGFQYNSQVAVTNIYSTHTPEQLNKLMKHYHDELQKRKYTICPFFLESDGSTTGKDYHQVELIEKTLYFYETGNCTSDISPSGLTILNKGKTLFGAGSAPTPSGELQQVFHALQVGPDSFDDPEWTGSGTWTAHNRSYRMDGYTGTIGELTIYKNKTLNAIGKVTFRNLVTEGDINVLMGFYGTGTITRWVATPEPQNMRTKVVLYISGGGSGSQTYRDIDYFSYSCNGTITISAPLVKAASQGVGEEQITYMEEDFEEDDPSSSTDIQGGYVYSTYIVPADPNRGYVFNGAYASVSMPWNFSGRRTITSFRKFLDGNSKVYHQLNICYRVIDVVWHCFDPDFKEADVGFKYVSFDPYSDEYKAEQQSEYEINFIYNSPSGMIQNTYKTVMTETPLSNDIKGIMDQSYIEETIRDNGLDPDHTYFANEGADYLAMFYYDWTKFLNS